MDIGQGSVETLLSAWALILVMNVVTFPLPPAWMVMAAFHAATEVPLLPLTVGGSAAAALGRTGFTLLIGRGSHRLPADMRANAEALAAYAHRRLRWPAAVVVLYSFLPLSSDPVFVAVGLGALPLHSSVIAFFLARSVFNTLMVLGSKPLTSSLADLFAGHVTWQSILVCVASIAGYAVFLKLPWARWLGVEPSRRSSAG